MTSPREKEQGWEPPVAFVFPKSVAPTAGATTDISTLSDAEISSIRFHRMWFVTPNRVHGLQHRIIQSKIRDETTFCFCGYICVECQECFLITETMAKDSASLTEGLQHSCTGKRS